MALGLIGGLLIVTAWLIPTIRREKEGFYYTVLFFTGAVFLLMYSVSIKDYLFMLLNITAAALALFNLGLYSEKEIRQETTKIAAEVQEIIGRKGKKYYTVRKR